MKIKTLTTEFIILANKKICKIHSHNHICAHPEKIESALHAAIYPGISPFIHGGVIEIGAAMFFYLIKAHAFFDGNKRTALISTVVFLESNGWTVKYPISKKRNDFAKLAENCAMNIVNLQDIKVWFNTHKIKI